MNKAICSALLASLTLAGPSGETASPEDEARAAIRKLNGEVTCDANRPGSPVIAVNL
jgi:hypothetical protein